MKSWSECKQEGSGHYTSGDVEPIDLFRAGDMFHDKACGDIIKYAFRSRRELNIDRSLLIRNMTKIIHLAELLMAEKEV